MSSLLRRFFTESDVGVEAPNGGENGSNTLLGASTRHVRFTSRDNLSPINSDPLTVSVTDPDQKVLMSLVILFIQVVGWSARLLH